MSTDPDDRPFVGPVDAPDLDSGPQLSEIGQALQIARQMQRAGRPAMPENHLIAIGLARMLRGLSSLADAIPAAIRAIVEAEQRGRRAAKAELLGDDPGAAQYVESRAYLDRHRAAHLTANNLIDGHKRHAWRATWHDASTKLAELIEHQPALQTGTILYTITEHDLDAPDQPRYTPARWLTIRMIITPRPATLHQDT